MSGCFPTATEAAALTHAFQQVRVVVEAVLAIALVAGLRVHALALLADLRPKQYAFIDVCRATGRGRPHPLPARPLRPRSRGRGVALTVEGRKSLLWPFPNSY